MKTIKKTVLLMGVSAIAAFSAPAMAADAPAAGQTFGIIDMRKVMNTSDAAKDVISQIEVKSKEYQAQISKDEDSLRSAEQELIKQKDTLSKEAFDDKYKALAEKGQQEQKLVQEKKSILDRAFDGAMTTLRQDAAAIVRTEAKDKHYSAVFLADAVMMSTPDLDMTDEVVAELNKTVKKIPVDWASAMAVSEAASGGPAKSSKKK
jgi:outer membrane protein